MKRNQTKAFRPQSAIKRGRLNKGCTTMRMEKRCAEMTMDPNSIMNEITKRITSGTGEYGGDLLSLEIQRKVEYYLCK